MIKEQTKEQFLLLLKKPTTLFIIFGILGLLVFTSCIRFSSTNGSNNEENNSNVDTNTNTNVDTNTNTNVDTNTNTNVDTNTNTNVDTNTNTNVDTNTNTNVDTNTNTNVDTPQFDTVSAANCAESGLNLNCFISVWNTTNSHESTLGLFGFSSSNQIKLALAINGEYDFYVDWGDASAVDHITAYTDPTATHTYASEGEYTVHIAGKIKGWSFYVDDPEVIIVGDATKLEDVTQWGSLSLGDTDGSQFYRAEHFNPTATDTPDLSDTKNLQNSLRGAYEFNGAIENWDVSTITNMGYMFRETRAFNQPLAGWANKLTNVTNMYEMFTGAIVFDRDISSWNVDSVDDYTRFANGSPINGTEKIPPKFRQ